MYTLPFPFLWKLSDKSTLGKNIVKPYFMRALYFTTLAPSP